MAQDGLAYSWTTTQPISVYELSRRALRVEGASNQMAPGTKMRNLNGRIRSVNIRLRPYRQVKSISCHVAGAAFGAMSVWLATSEALRYLLPRTSPLGADRRSPLSDSGRAHRPGGSSQDP